MHEELVKRLNTRLEAVGDAIDAALPEWEGDYPDAIKQLASEIDRLREQSRALRRQVNQVQEERDEACARAERLAEALRDVKEWTIGNAFLTSPEREVCAIATFALASTDSRAWLNEQIALQTKGEYKSWSCYLEHPSSELRLSSDPRAREISLAMEREIAEELERVKRDGAPWRSIERYTSSGLPYSEPVVLVSQIDKRIAELRRKERS